ncbi:CDP-alcohol phosphatidyltransferase family protein [Leptolyngbya sp. 7M]|uniref:CDP-alcohol phosphatidyltransferase family protein n=1 Tax=Leptolyngbya sp. 7M TaxID=2812896 RepID=UPI001B8CEE23|nr:CDP-alcohol phosphatidyltransferase family protein [Leptolyngbya sp. 7M]QYO63694.1 CDP-alcohol phosphatidyltransferase family protein [Leptolyngbya sp. 7M]
MPTDLHRVLPNAITVARLVMATGVFVLLSLQPYHARARAQALHDPDLAQAAPLDWLCLLAAGLFALAALSDALDGLLARRWNAITPFGRVMDPMADKILVLGAFILLAGPGFTDLATGRQMTAVAPWMAVVMLARELLVTSLRGVMESRGVDFSATWSGKLKMILQSACVPLVLLVLGAGDPIHPGPQRDAVSAAVWLTVAITVWC